MKKFEQELKKAGEKISQLERLSKMYYLIAGST